MKKHLRYFLTLLLVMVASVGWADTYTIGWGTASGDAGTYTNFEGTGGSVDGIVSYSTEKNSSSSNPAYNEKSNELRLYYHSSGNGGSITLTPAEGITITGIVMTTSTSPSVNYFVDGGTATNITASDNTYTISGISATSSLKIQNANTSNTQLRIKTIAITYSSSSGSSTVATPTFSPVAGTYNDAQNVTISTTTTDATIYYTIDGTDPTTTSSVYSAAIPVTENTTIKAYAVKDGLTDSEIATAEYVINYKVATPTFTPAAGTYNDTQNVTISTTTKDATIYYTTDGTDPTVESSVYSDAIPVSETTTIKAIATKDGYTSSDIATAAYTIKLINVNPKNIGSNYFVKVTDVADLEDGDAVLIVSQTPSLRTMSTTQNPNNRGYIAVTATNDAIEIGNVPTAQRLVLTVAEEGKWMFCVGTAASDGFLYAVSGSNYLRTKTDPDATATATIAIISDGNDATIKFGTTDNRYLRYNSNNGIFSCYGSGQQDVQIYKEIVKPTNVKNSAEFAFSATQFYVAKDVETFTEPTLAKAEGYDGTPTYSSSNTEVATVDASTGAVEIVGVGTTEIKAAAAETDNFYADTVTYTLNVYEIEDGVFEFAKGNYLSGVLPTTINTEVLESTWTAGNVTMETSGRVAWWNADKSLRVYGASGEKADGSLVISVPAGYVMTRIDVTGGTALTASVDAADGEGTKTGTIWTGRATKVTFTRGSSNSTLTKIVVEYYPEDGITVNVGETEYATLYYKNVNLVVPEGVTAKAYSVSGTALNVVQTYNAGDVIPAGTGVVLNGTIGDYQFAISAESGTAAEGNMLRGSDEDKTTTGGAKYYMLSLNADSDPSSVGFYYGATDGAAFTNKAHRAYLAVPEGTEAKATGYAFNEVTGINDITREQVTDGAWYTIDGKRLNGEPTVKGIYVVNGKKVVIK